MCLKLKCHFIIFCKYSKENVLSFKTNYENWPGRTPEVGLIEVAKNPEKSALVIIGTFYIYYWFSDSKLSNDTIPISEGWVGKEENHSEHK